MHPGQRADTPELKQHILDELAGIWTRNPNLRLGQLIANPFIKGHSFLFLIEDSDLITVLQETYPEEGNHDTETDPL